MGNILAESLSVLVRSSEEVLPDIELLRLGVVNVVMIGSPSDTNWVLVDTGLENSAQFIERAADRRFGPGTRPQSIILTHGHFDHVGSAVTLANDWDVPVYIHSQEIPYIKGEKDYPLGDPSVSGGLIARMSSDFPHSAIDLGIRAASLPEDNSVPGLPAWKWIRTPGHSEGHISLFREQDRVLIAGDALTTTRQESLFWILTQRRELGGPPAYMTTNWKAAEDSVKRLRDLEANLVITSHGPVIKGAELEKELDNLAINFRELAVPEPERHIY